MNRPNKSKTVKRNGCFEAIVLTAVGFTALAIVIPMFVTIKMPNQPAHAKSLLEYIYKECAVKAAKGEGNDLRLSSLNSFKKFFNYSYGWRLSSVDSRTPPDPSQECLKASLAVIPPSYKAFKQLEFRMSSQIQNHQKSCITREGDQRDDWSCE